MHRQTKIPDALRALRTKLGANQRDFADLIGVTPGAVGHWEAGRSRPTPMALMTIGNLGGADREYWYSQAGADYATTDLVTQKLKDTYRISDEDNRIVMVYGPPEGGAFKEHPELAVAKLSISRTMLPDLSRPVAFTVTDEGMAPMIQANWIVIVDRLQKVPAQLDNRIVAVSTGDGLLVRRLRKSGPGYLMVPNSLGSEHPMIPYRRDDHPIIGRVILWIGRDDQPATTPKEE